MKLIPPKSWILSLLLLLIAVSVISCSSLGSNWSRITTDVYDFIIVDPDRNMIWAANVFGKEIVGIPLGYEQLPSEYLKFNLPPDTRVWGMCLSTNQVITLVNPKSSPYNILMTFDLERSIWKEIGIEKYPLSSRCKVLVDGSIIIVVGDKFDLIKNDIVTRITPRIGRIWDVAQDNQGNLWAITLDKFVFVNEGDNQWRNIATSEIGDLLFDIESDSIWISTGLNLLRVVEENQGIKTQLVYQINGQSHIIAVYTEADGTIWVVSSSAIARKRNMSFIEMPLPAGADVIYSSGLDSKNKIIYIATDRGLYSIESNQ